MLVTSSQSSTQRPLGLSVEELFALDRQYRRIEQQQQHLAQLQAQTRQTSSNLNRLASRSLDLISSPPLTPLTILPSLEVHGHSYSNRPPPPPIPPPTLPTVLNYPRSHSIDQLRYIPPPPPPPVLKHTYPQRSKVIDVGQQNYESKYRPYMQQSTMPEANQFMSDVPSFSADYSDNRASCKLRRQQAIKRESSRRIVVRPVVHRRREPSVSSSCESLDEARSPIHRLPVEFNIPNQSGPFTPSTSLVEDIVDDLSEETNKLNRSQSNSDSLSDDSEINLYEMRVSIGKTYDTSDISVQLEGSKILIHCHTIEPTDKRGNYRKHEYKSELLVPDVVNDETIVAYLTEDGQLIVEGKYHLWAWKEIQKKRRIEQEELKNANLTSTAKSHGGDLEEKNLRSTNRIETLDNNRTVIHVGESTKSVSDIINRFNTLTNNIWDGQYSFTNDNPSILIYYLRLPFQTLMDSIRIQSDPELNLLKIFIEQQERNLIEEEQNEKLIIRSTSRVCRLPKDYQYDYNHLRVQFLKDNFIRIEIPTLNSEVFISDNTGD